MLVLVMAAPLLIAWCAWVWLSFVPAVPTAYVLAREPGLPPRVIARQGGDGLLPGNTLEALSNAWDLGADALHFDVRASADGELVAMHDADVGRTTEGQGALNRMSLTELQALDAAHHWPGGTAEPRFRGTGVRVPLVRDILGALPASTRFVIDLKADDPEAALDLCALLREIGAGGRVLVASAVHQAMTRFREACPEVATSATESEVRRFVLLSQLGLPVLFRTRALVLQVPRRTNGVEVLDAAFVTDAHARGLQVDVLGVSTREELRAVMALGVDGVITDRPDLALAVRAPPR